MADYGHAGRPSTYLAAESNSHPRAHLSSCLSPFSGNVNAKILMSGSLRRATSIKLRVISVKRHRDLQIAESCRVPVSLFFKQGADPQTNGSRQNRKDASGKTGAALWFWETDDDDRADLRHLIKIREQFYLIMIGAQDVGLE